MAKYRNKKTGVIVEAMQITLKSNIAQDILDFGEGLISSIEEHGFSPNEVHTFILKLTTRTVPCADTYIVKVGDYILRNEETIFYMHEKEFKKHFEQIENTSRPPIGLIPRKLFVEIRIQDIKDAIHRYSLANKVIPIEWIEEYNDLTKYLKEN